MADTFIINGGRDLEGEIEVRGSKNAAGACLAAVLLTRQECILDNVPLISDVKNQIEILKSLGVTVEYLSERRIKFRAEDINVQNLDLEKFSKTRMSVVVVGALLTRFHYFQFSSPGGDKIGIRPINIQLEALEKLGANIKKEGDLYNVYREELRGAEVVLTEFSPTATEALMLAAVLAKGKTIIKGAASETSVQNLGDMLLKMGARIKGNGSHTLEIDGVESLHGCEHTIVPDHLEAGTFIVAAALTPGKVVVKNIDFDYLDLFLEKLKEIGVIFEKEPNQVTVFYSPKLTAAKVQALPHPGFPTDLLPMVVTILTRAEGKSLIHDPLYEGRFGYMAELKKMGADIEVVDPHRAFVFGSKNIQGVTVNSLDVRAGAVLILAGLMAEGRTVINDVFHIDRGYEKIEERLQRLGADIKRISN